MFYIVSSLHFKRPHAAFCLRKQAHSCFLVFGLGEKSTKEGLEEESSHLAGDLLKCENVSSVTRVSRS